MAMVSYIQNFSKIGDKNFFDIEGSPLWIFQKIHDFLNDFRGKGGAGHTSSCLDTTKIGLNLTLNMVIWVASPPLPVATLTPKERSVGGWVCKMSTNVYEGHWVGSVDVNVYKIKV